MDDTKTPTQPEAGRPEEEQIPVNVEKASNPESEQPVTTESPRAIAYSKEPTFNQSNVPIHGAGPVEQIAQKEQKHQKHQKHQQPRKKHSGVLIALGILIVVLFGLLVAALYIKWSEADKATADLSVAKTQVAKVENDLAAAKLADEDAEPVAANKAKTTQELADELVAGHKTMIVDKTYAATATVKGDLVTVAIQKQNADVSRTAVYKKVGDKLVAVVEYVGQLSAEEKAQIKTLYGIDIAN